MATDLIVSDAGTIYKRLLNHRPVIQNEVHYFVKEFESKREDSDLKSLQDAMKKANEMDAIFLEDIKAASPKFRQIMTKIEDVAKTGSDFLDGERPALTISGEEYDKFDQRVEECRKQLQEKQDELDSKNEQEVERLKKEIQCVREDRSKLRSVTSSSASVTIYPPSTPSSEGVQSNEHSLSGSPDTAQRGREASNSKVDDDEKTEAQGSTESEAQEEKSVEPETVIDATKE